MELTKRLIMHHLSLEDLLNSSRRRRLFETMFTVLAVFACLALPPPLFSQSVDSTQESATAETGQSIETLAAELDVSPDQGLEYEKRPSLDHVRALIGRDALQLAYRVVGDARIHYENTVDWTEWETLFLELGWQLGAWSDLIDRADQLQGSEVYPIAQTFAVMAEIELNRHVEALKRLRALISRKSDDRGILMELRQLIAQIYMVQGNVSDAEIALTQFDRDYRPSTPEWEHRYIRVLLRNDQLNEAMVRLAPLQTLEAQFLDFYAQFTSHLLSPSDTVLKGLEIESQFEKDATLHAELWALIEVAARAYNDFEMQTKAIESALSIEHAKRSNWEHLPVVQLNTETQLVNTYERFALFVGNDIGLIVGDDESWHRLAQEFEITSPITARAVHAYLARNAYSIESRKRSTAALATLLFEAGFYRLLDHLFVRSDAFDLAAVPRTIQSRLANVALRNNDFNKALTIIDVMSAPAESEPLTLWLLRQARIAIYISEFDRGERLLEQVIDRLPQVAEQSKIGAIAQVVFDLQERDRHASAIRLLVQIYGRSPDVQTKREILRWMSESYSAQGNHAYAADHLIRSAALGDRWEDEWALSARLKAGEEMIKAGFINDARAVYAQLHEDALDPRQRALIADQLQRLSTADAVRSE